MASDKSMDAPTLFILFLNTDYKTKALNSVILCVFFFTH